MADLAKEFFLYTGLGTPQNSPELVETTQEREVCTLLNLASPNFRQEVKT